MVRSDSAELVTEQVRELLRRAAAVGADLATSSGLHPTDVRALRVLDAAGARPLPVGELGAGLGLSSASTTALVDRLEAAGMARREPDRQDRRRVLISLSDEARRFGDRRLAPLGTALEKAVEASDEASLAAVAAFLGVLLDG